MLAALLVFALLQQEDMSLAREADRALAKQAADEATKLDRQIVGLKKTRFRRGSRDWIEHRDTLSVLRAKRARVRREGAALKQLDAGELKPSTAGRLDMERLQIKTVLGPQRAIVYGLRFHSSTKARIRSQQGFARSFQQSANPRDMIASEPFILIGLSTDDLRDGSTIVAERDDVFVVRKEEHPDFGIPVVERFDLDAAKARILHQGKGR